MARAREIKRKILTIEGTRKITRTMEKIATARARQNQNRLRAAAPYARGLMRLLGDVMPALPREDHPLLREPAVERGVAIVVVTSNRGLCGGFNSHLVRTAEALRESLEAERKKVSLFVIGRKGIGRYRYIGRQLAWSSVAFDDRPKFPAVAELADLLIDGFATGRFDRVAVVSMRFLVSNEGHVETTTLLPAPRDPAAPKQSEYLFEGDVGSLADRLVPAAVKAGLYGLLLANAAAEQIARRVAMKAATDNAEEMIKLYRRLYYRTRQSGITLELMDIVGGANAVAQGL